ncbi:MAG TPA: phage portal protein [Kofleriaceae bacterium]|nr:phage portal protein [Kofleriaceae bacterium]
MPWADIEQREQAFAGMGVVTPPYDPETLAILFENSSSLRQNVDAYVTNIDAFGHRFESVIDLDADDAERRIGNALFIERERAKTNPLQGEGLAGEATGTAPSDQEVAAKKAEVAAHMRLERSRLETFFSFCAGDISFVTLRRRTRQDVEVMGNGYWEVLRNGAGDIVQFVYIPGFTMRLLPTDLAFVEVESKVKISELSYDVVRVRRRFRRYVQIFEGQVVFFKELGDPRVLSRKHGLLYATVDALLAEDPTDGPATEILHFKLHNPRSAYGTPRWIGTLLSVLGSRQAEEINYLYFENKSVPPLALLVSGGRLSAQSVPRIESFIETHLKGKKNFHKILVLEAESPGGSGLDHTGRMKIELRPLTGAQQNDALFQIYDERNSDKIGQSFRLPKLVRGDIRDANRSTADAALTLAEMQVFQPEREEFDFVVNHKILAELGIRFWRFRSNSPVTRDPAAMSDIVRGLVNANVLTPEEGRALAGDVFNRELKPISASWVKQPVSLTLAGIPPTPEPQRTVPAPEVQKDDASTRDLATSGGLRSPAQGPSFGGGRRRRDPAWDLAGEAARLITLRDALREAEGQQAAQAFHIDKRAELEREVLKVPADELASWFASESTR